MIQLQNCLCTIASVVITNRSVVGKCSECKLIKPMTSGCASSEQKIKISQFEVTETPYKKTVDGKELDKISKKKQKKNRVYHDLSFKMSI